ncbi:MAG: hypothetical protein H0X25_24240, partial [Acidobacteriales bacterium]|nr:hypothetical protein [Terriglobales bacterium]
IQQFIDDQTVAGAVTLTAHASEVIEFDALGKADIEAGRAMAKNTIFRKRPRITMNGGSS